MRQNVVVAGRVVMDFHMDLSEFPILGHSVLASSFRPEPGGKGLNIAAALARLGLRPFLLAKVGGDDIGTTLASVLDREGVNRELVLVDRDERSGIIVCLVDNITSREAHIIANPHASRLTEQYIESIQGMFSQMDAAVITPGISAQTAIKVLELAKKNNPGIVVVFQFKPHEFLTETQIETLSRNSDFLMGTAPNIAYLLSLLGIATHNDPAHIAGLVHQKVGFKAVCITDGVQGGAYVDEHGTLTFSPFPIDFPLDRTGAIDAFCAGFTACYLEEEGIRNCLRFATASGILAAQTAGGFPAMPLRNSVLRFLSMPRNQSFDLFADNDRTK